MAGTSWPDLEGGQKARASDVEAKFDWIEGSIVPMVAGNKTDGAYDLGESSYRWNVGYIKELASCAAREITLQVQTRYYKVMPGDLIPRSHQYGWDINPAYGQIFTAGTVVIAPVHLPQGASITGFKVFWYGQASASTAAVECNLVRSNHSATNATDFLTMAAANMINTLGAYSVEATSLTLTTVDVTSYNYALRLYAHTSATHYFEGALITYQIKGVLPLL